MEAKSDTEDVFKQEISTSRLNPRASKETVINTQHHSLFPSASASVSKLPTSDVSGI